MSSSRTQYTNIDEYIASFPPEVQKIMQELRAVIRSVAPDATETISYAIPTFVLHRNLVHFAAFAHHISLFPGADGVEHFREELAPYKTSKGTVHFPLDQPLPFDLVSRIVRYRVQVEMERATAKSKKK
jgi:uncharacterized protein YdhG (YjbR/CyaY superfamily)